MDIPEIREVSLTEALGRRRGATIDPTFLEQLTKALRKLSGDRALLIALPPEVKYATFRRWVSFAAERAGVKLVIRRDPGGLRCWPDQSTTPNAPPKKTTQRTTDNNMPSETHEEHANVEHSL
jgi:hypothetical protein